MKSPEPLPLDYDQPVIFSAFCVCPEDKDRACVANDTIVLRLVTLAASAFMSADTRARAPLLSKLTRELVKSCLVLITDRSVE